jgi:CHAT domain-containing protein
MLCISSSSHAFLPQKQIGDDRPRVWWCVTGELGFLPIHAAGKYGTDEPNSDCVSNYAVSSYIPTLSVLAKARRGWIPIPRAEVSGLLICEASSGRSYLPSVTEEVNVIRECFDAAHARVLNPPAPHTTIAQMRSLMNGPPAHILHLASHGVQEADPLKSAFLLQDGRLSIEAIMDFALPHAVLAFLSACQTAKGDANAPDQAVHLAASMLFCGFRSVIGTMW